MGPRVGMYMIEPENTIHISKDTYGHRTKILCLVVESQSPHHSASMLVIPLLMGKRWTGSGRGGVPCNIFAVCSISSSEISHHTYTADWLSGQLDQLQGISHLQMATHSTLGIKCATKPGLNSSGLVWTLVDWRWGEKPWGPNLPYVSSAGCGGAAPCDRNLLLPDWKQKENKSSCKQIRYGKITLIQCRTFCFCLSLIVRHSFYGISTEALNVYQGLTYYRPQTSIFVLQTPWGSSTPCLDFYCLGNFFPLGFSVSHSLEIVKGFKEKFRFNVSFISLWFFFSRILGCKPWILCGFPVANSTPVCIHPAQWSYWIL